ncbi:MAG: lytic transglycosylase domain-containing protein, partial [Chloroflexi bacterium]|nr:lytic transglycosylase domain-containing protein [Chloroflexota bacterium]
AGRALARYDELLRSSPWRDDQAAALSRTGALERDRGNLEVAQEAWFTLVNDYREYAESSEALGLLLDLGAQVDQLTIGIVRFHEERYVDARNAMLNVLGSSGELSEQVAGEFYIAAIHQRNDDSASAALGYAAVIGRDASDPLAAESAMQLADFAIDAGDQLTAEEHWRRVMLEHPGHERAVEAARRWASLATTRGQWLEAAQRFRDAANSGADFWGDRVRQELLFWSALMHLEAGDRETGLDLAEKVVEVNPVGYYALRAAHVFELGTIALMDLSTDEWLARLTGEANPSQFDIGTLSHWQAARDLRLGGFDDLADGMLLALIEELAGDPWALTAAAAYMSDRGEFSASARAAERVLAVFGLDWTEAPPALLRLAYPQPWPDVMSLHATAEGVDPLLLWSLIRRESFYEREARGLAGEVGLTQVIPLTGSDIAAGLGIEYQHDDLVRPELAIRFGAWYLKRQLEGFSNEPVMALAAYNAGPGNAARWEDAAALGGADGFLAALDFSSTRMYVQYVIEALAVYRALAEAGR